MSRPRKTLSERAQPRKNYTISHKALRRGDWKHFTGMRDGSAKLLAKINEARGVAA